MIAASGGRTSYHCNVDGFTDIGSDNAASLMVNESVRIPYADLTFRFTRSSGPGGQHVNKSETAVELLFDLANTPHLTDAERALAMQRLASYLDSDGVLHPVSQSMRSQLKNREDVVQRFVALLRQALIPPRRRRATRPSRAAHERRLARKRRIGEIKRQRQQRSLDQRAPDE
ncbi:MAG: aminoacyl-tRNA hydrolase [Chloroflexi bacterium]|nr:aminoacyl-tRNA hydrolase [Chloroflexota bacterium]